MSEPWPPAAPPARAQHGVAIRVIVVGVVVVLVGGYAALAYLSRDRWLGGAPTEDRTSVAFTAFAPDGSTPSPDELDRAREVLADRGGALGDADVALDGTTLTVSVGGADESELKAIGRAGRLELRPVIHSIPTQAGTAAPPQQAPGAGPPQVVADEKSLRQSDDPNIQVLALQFQASRCGRADPLVGNDDPTLPLVTCSQDGAVVYLLSPSVINGDEVARATAGFDESYGEHVVDVEFTSAGAGTWGDFTAKHVGTQVAFTLDTAVVSAPEIREAIPGGRTQITGRFTESDARGLASVLGHGTLPVTLVFDSADTAPGPPAAASTPVRVALAASGLLLALVVLGTVVYLVVTGRRRPAVSTERGAQ